MVDDEHEADRRQIQVFIATVASMMSEAARDRAERQRQLASDMREQARSLEAQYATERVAAQALWEPALKDDWWARASVEDIQTAYRAAAEWEQVDTGAGLVAERIRDRAGAPTGETANERSEQVPVLSMAASQDGKAVDMAAVAYDSRERRAATAAALTEAAADAGASAEVVSDVVEAHMLADQSVGVDTSPTARPAQSASTAKAPTRVRQQERTLRRR